ncbi:MAG: F0F1 ATP synthase subunit delta [Clostridia bacterium]|nr:F0F1 ATP synthase subunit delta [Clostridia bacterium]
MISASKYGQALFSLASEQGCADSVLDDLRVVKDVLTNESQAMDLLESPSVTANEKREFVRQVFGQSQQILVNTLLVLCDYGEINSLPDILQAYSDCYDKANNICRIHMTTAVPVPDEQSGRLLVQLERTTGMSVVLEKSVDPDLIGGAVLDFPDRRIDSSIRTRLRAIQETLTETIN